MSRFVVHMANGEKLAFEKHWWSDHQSGALEIMLEPDGYLVMLIAPGQWHSIKPMPPLPAPSKPEGGT